MSAPVQAVSLVSAITRPRLLAALPVAAVAVFAGIVSYSHIYELAVRTGQAGTAARLLPLSVDLLIVAGSVILLADSARSRLGWLGVGPGVAATLFANIESGVGRGWLAAMVAAWPALAFSLASFMLERWLRGQRQPAQASSGQCPHTAPADVGAAVVTAFLHSRDCEGEPVSQRQLSARFGLPRHRVAELVGPLNGQHPREAVAG